MNEWAAFGSWVLWLPAAWYTWRLRRQRDDYKKRLDHADADRDALFTRLEETSRALAESRLELRRVRPPYPTGEAPP